jgi:hypothetical protein
LQKYVKNHHHHGNGEFRRPGAPPLRQTFPLVFLFNLFFGYNLLTVLEEISLWTLTYVFKHILYIFKLKLKYFVYIFLCVEEL